MTTTVDRPKRGFRPLGRNPLGLLFSAPYLIFVLAIFAFPVLYSVWISFHAFYFAAPGAKVSRPWVGFDNYVTALTDPAVIRSFGNVGIFLIINVPLTVVLSMLLATAL
ncbi:MAG: sugar transporter permease, partial [Microbacteriaceae bacterium]|nr:sugar transporter permease [Microbacteriaceae bacterium]